MSEMTSTISANVSSGIQNGASEMSFSSRDLGMFRHDSLPNNNIVSKDFGTEARSQFARSESFENQVKDNKPMFDLSRPAFSESNIKTENQNIPTEKSDTKEAEEYENKIVNEGPVRDIELISNHTFTLWERPKNQEAKTVQHTKKDNTANQLGNNDDNYERASIKNHQSKVNSETEVVAPDNSKEGVENHNPAVEQSENIINSTEHYPDLQEDNEADAKNFAVQTLEPVRASASQAITSYPQHQYQTAEKNVREIKDMIRLMPDADEVTITLPVSETKTNLQTQPQVMDSITLEELVRAESLSAVRAKLSNETEAVSLVSTQKESEALAKTKTETVVKTQTETSTQTQTKTENQNAVETKTSTQTQEKQEEINRKKTATGQTDKNSDKHLEKGVERKLKIKKAWFTKDVVTNKNREWEVVKAYISVHYKWLRQYITKIDGSEVAKAIRQTRDEEKMESQSIKRIEKDGSIKPYTDVIDKINEIGSFDELDRAIRKAEKEFTATNFTENPQNEIADGDEILAVHNNKDIFEAKLDGEIVTVLAKGVSGSKKPEFISVEVE